MPSTLSPDDSRTLRRLAALAGRHLDLLLDGAGRKETLRGAYDLAEELGAWLRRAAPRAARLTVTPREGGRP